MRSNRRRAWWFGACFIALLFYTLYVLYYYHEASDPLKSFSEATTALSDSETRLSFEAYGIHSIWLLPPQGTPVQQAVKARDEIVRGMSASLDGKKLELTDSRVLYQPDSEVCGNDTLTYLANLDASGEVELVVKIINRGVVPIGSKLVVEKTAAGSEGAAIDLGLSTILRNNLGMTDAVAALAFAITWIVNIARRTNRSINRPRG